MKNQLLAKRFVAPVLRVSCLAASNLAFGALVTSGSGYSGPFIDLSGQANGEYNFTFGPVALPGMTFTSASTASNSGLGAVLGQGGYGLGDNGSYDSTPVYAGVDAPNGYIRFTLTSPVSSFGAYVNYCQFDRSNCDANGEIAGDPTMSVLDSGGGVIESWNLKTDAPISTPGGLNAFEFRGIELSTASIYALEFSNSYILATGTPNGLPVPEPETYAMLLAGLGLMGLVARRRKQKLMAA